MRTPPCLRQPRNRPASWPTAQKRTNCYKKGQSELGSEEIVLYTQTYLQVTTVDALTGTDGSINSVTLDISPKGQVVASTASTAGDINQGNSVVVKEIPPGGSEHHWNRSCHP